MGFSGDPIELMRSLFWSPFDEREGGMMPSGAFSPAVEFKETGESYALKVDLPGIRDEDIEVSVMGNRISISGKREEEQAREGERFYAYEREYGSFTRSFTLPLDAKGDEVRAELKDGVLHVTVPKVPEVHPKHVAIKTKSSVGSDAGELGGKSKEEPKIKNEQKDEKKVA